MPSQHLALASTAEEGIAPDEPGNRPMVSVELLAPHPRNARKDLNLTADFLASIVESGVLVPLRITHRTDGTPGYWVIDGGRRLAGAVKAGHAEVPYDLAAERADDLAGQFLDMFVTSRHREQLSPLEEADALFAAREAGASRTRIRKAAGLTAGEVSAALAAATLDPQVRDSVAAVPRDLKLDELALVAEFTGDPEAVQRLTRAAAWGRLEHEAELLRAERADLAEQQRQRTELEAAGVAITDDLPADARLLSHLRHDDADITTESHAGCPGHSVFFYSWAPAVANYYCADPGTYGHTLLWQAATPGSTNAGGTRDEADAEAERAARRLVIAGNRAWKAAGEVRKRWVATFLSRRDRGGPPPAVARWVTGQLIVMPEPLRSGLPMATVRDLFRELSGGRGASDLASTVGTVPAARLPLLMLTAIATAYEHAMTEGEQAKGTWRTGRYTTCPREQAGEYLSFLAGLGYQLSSIEQSVADGVAWTGDTASGADPGEPADATTAAGTPGTAEDTGALAAAGEDHPGDESSPDQDSGGMSSGDHHEAEPAAAVDQPPWDLPRPLGSVSHPSAYGPSRQARGGPSHAAPRQGARQHVPARRESARDERTRTMADEPPVRRRIIGAALRRYRQDLGYGLDDAATVLDCDTSKMSRIETGHRGIRPKELRELLTEYSVPPAEQQALIALAGPPGRWRDLHPAAADIILIEAAAAEISVYDPQLIPDLLQVPGYAGAVSAAQDRPHQPVSHQLDDIAGTLAAHHQAVLEAGTQLSVVIGEAALHQEVGGPAVMTAQIARLIEAAGQHPQLTLQIIPFTAGAHVAIRGGAHTIIQLAPGIGAVYLPGITGGTVLDSQADLAMYTSASARLRTSALSARASLRMLRALLRDRPLSR